MTDAVLILRKLTLMREHIARVRRRRPAELAAFVADVDVQDALWMSLLVAIQESLDMALHIAADEGWGVAGSYAESFELLATHGVVSVEHARELARTTALRNRLAHGYASVDLERLWGEIPAGLDALERFAAIVARLAAPG